MRTIRCADKLLTFEHPLIMGVLNVTPDSFSDGGTFYDTHSIANDASIDLSKVVEEATRMVSQGTAVLDVGGESTRPGAQPVTIAQELSRVIPVVEKLSGLDTIVSVDTRHAVVAAAAIEAGADMINDVSAGADPDMLAVVAGSTVGYAFMHMQGEPQTMQQAPNYSAVVAEVANFLDERYRACLASGITVDRLIADPGFGFGKTLTHNVQLLAHLSEVRPANLALLVGLSRKSMIGSMTGKEVNERIYGSVTAAVLAAQNGADLIRVHDVDATNDALQVLKCVTQNG